MKGALLDDPKGVLVQQTENVQSARQIRFTSVGDVTKLEKTVKAYLRQAIENECPGELEEEIGDLLFSVVNLARKLRIESEVALRKSTEKFAWRFRELERVVRERGLVWERMTLVEMDAVWEEVKRGA